jgi:D-aspartate ligase
VSGPAALVVDVAWVSGLAAIRSLGRAGVPVLALDHRRSALGFRSRYGKPVLCPDPQDEDEFVAFIARLGEELAGPVPVLATHDEPLNAIARHSDELGNAFRYPFPPWDVLSRIQSKLAQYEAAEAAGVAVPRTRSPGSAAEARAAAEELGYPVLVKPSSTEGFKRRFARQAFRCETGNEVERAYAEAEGYEPLVQEVIPGGDDRLFTLGSYLATDG